jgi:hypothetical protein
MAKYVFKVVQGIAILALASCSSGTPFGRMAAAPADKKSAASAAAGEKTSNSATTEESPLVDGGSDRQIYPAEQFDESVTAVPPQIVTGAYLVCSTLDQTDANAMADMPTGFPAASQDVYSCGIQTSEREKHPAIASFQVLTLQCGGEPSTMDPGMMEAPAASIWSVFFQIPKTRACKLESIHVEVEINGTMVTMETKIAGKAMPMPPPTYHIMFVTNAVYPTGTAYPLGFNSIETADQICTDAAAKGGVTNFKSAWKAIISSKTIDAKIHISIYADVYNTKMEKLYETGAIWSKLLANVLDENNVLMNTDDGVQTKVWTASKDDGRRSDSTCNNWTANGDNIDAAAGDLGSFSSNNWISAENKKCDQELHLYCMSQLPAPAVAPKN